MRLQAIRARQAAIRSRLTEIEGLPEPEGDDEARGAEFATRATEVDALLDEFDALETKAAPLQERADKMARALAAPASAPAAAAGGAVERAFQGAPQVMRKVSPFDVLEDRSTRGQERVSAVRGGVLKALEERDLGGAANEKHVERLLVRHGSDIDWAENLLGRARPEYATGFAKCMTGNAAYLSDAERAAMAVGTATAGGLLVPTHLDPTLIITNSGSSNLIRGISKVVTLTVGNDWNGVTTAGVTASWDGELAEVSDDTPALAAATVATHVAQAFVQASISAFQDIDGLSSDVLMLFADARDRLEGAAHATGSGSSQPKGIFTAVDASASLEVTSTTAATIGLVDIHSLYRTLPVRWRGRSTWVMNPLYSLAIKALGTALSASYSTDITQAMAGSLLGRPLVESDDAPTTQTTTALDPEVVIGDFSGYCIVDMPGGFSVEYIPHMFNTANNLPDGRRGWFAYWRNGADAVNLAGFRLLVDKTSA